MTKSYLVRPTIDKWEKMKLDMEQDFESLDRDHFIYLPQSFVLGNLKERKYGFVFTGIFYQDSAEYLQDLQQMIEEGKLEIRTELNLEDDDISALKRNADIIFEARSELDQILRSSGDTDIALARLGLPKRLTEEYRGKKSPRIFA
ncbi:hypothetical protein HYT57_00545 [Candidatus Woesearchaeota archaeon]|nr:hypothetical protein [Candidatus Woesearchaeota archaeon]